MRALFNNKPASVILRRQVPVRFDEPARSWFGGLPQMPDGIPWPRTANKGTPLHFIAQIACADLPKRLWNGRGPRDGWLLLFVDVLQLENVSEEDEEAEDIETLGDVVRFFGRRVARSLGRYVPVSGGGLVQVLHIDRLGPERQPPDDMTTVRHAMGDGIGLYEPAVREGVPKLWRRWPVDVVFQEVPALPPMNSKTNWEPLRITGAGLYGSPEDDRHIDHFVDVEPRPLTWRGALYLVDGLIETFLAQFAFDGLRGPPSSEPGWLAAKIAQAEKSIRGYEADAAKGAAALADPASDMTPDQRVVCQSHVVGNREAAAMERGNIADLSVFLRPGGEAELGAEMERTSAAHLKWRTEQIHRLDALRIRILGKDLEAPLGADGWTALKAELIASPTEYWNKWDYAQRKVQCSVLYFAGKWLTMALREDVLDLYTRDAASRAAIPPDILAQIEPKLRNIGPSTAPHRMGGPRDVVQSYAEQGDDDLLFQIFSDDAMGWMWGDVGALFVYVKPHSLKMRWFKCMYAWLDGH
jgi:hypothetical protein